MALLVTCQTTGCTEVGIQKTADNSPDPDGNTPTRFICGVCGRDYTDIKPPAGQ